MLPVHGTKRQQNASFELDEGNIQSALHWTHASSWSIDLGPQKSPWIQMVERELACIFGIYVDDLVGCGDLQDPYFLEVKEKLKNVLYVP